LHLLILGASARAAACSACRAGFQPVAADLFADRDLKAIAPVERIEVADYPEGLAAAAAAAEPSPWMYTGSLENHPDLVERIARQRPLWGNDGGVLRSVRNPRLLAAALRDGGFCGPPVRFTSRGLPRDGSWLVKPLASAGGRKIVPLAAREEDARSPGPERYYQKRISGPSLAALFVAPGKNNAGSEAVLTGVTRQWLGHPAAPFGYVGSLGPWPISGRARNRIAALGRWLAAEFGLVGLFGIDLILRAGEPWTIEVNPRYTASVEVIELALGRSLLADHAFACDPSTAPNFRVTAPPQPDRPRFVGKLIVFAVAQCRFPAVAYRVPSDEDPFAIPRIGDIPERGTRFERGDPVLTLFAHASTADACRRLLVSRRTRWLRRLSGSR
jgi:predicted ATP-grasp superfamily ATP-dependent carboligase